MAGTLTIGRLRADCRVAGSPSAAAGVRDRTLRALRDHLPPVLRSGLAPLLDGSDDSVWIVRRLDVTIAVDADAPPDDLAARTARSFGQILGETLRDQGDGVNAIRFSSRTNYLAQFIVAAATSDPWSRWYFAPLLGWKALPASAAIRTALTENPEHGHQMLQSLDDRALACVVNALRPDDERAVLASLTRSRADVPMAVAMIREALTGCGRALRIHLTSGHTLFALARSSGAPSPALLAAVRAVLKEVELKQSGERRNRGESPPSGGLASLEGFDAMPVTDRSSIVASVRKLAGLSHGPEIADPDHASDPELFVTPFGGLSLLLREGDALPWEEWTADWPSLASVPPQALLRWLAIAGCGGRLHVASILRDSVWRLLLDIPADLTIDDLVGWASQVDARLWRTLLRVVSHHNREGRARGWLAFRQTLDIDPDCARTLARIVGVLLNRFANRLPGFSASTPEYLWRNVLAFDAVVECEPDRILVRCGRPPLHLVLSLTGMTRGLHVGRLVDGRPILVFSRE